jgi:hypothetical protein
MKLVALVLTLALPGAAAAQSTFKLCVPVPAQPGGVAGCQDVNANFPLPITGGTGGGGGGGTASIKTNPGPQLQMTLDAKTVATGGAPTTVIAAGNRTGGGFLTNPGPGALCINEIGAASGTTSFGDTTCIVSGQPYYVSAGAGAVSATAADSGHPISGYGLKNP